LWAARDTSALSLDRAWNLPSVGAMARAQGEVEEAWAVVREGLPDGPQTEPGTTHFTAVDLCCLAARLALDAGDHAQTRQWLEAHDRWLTWAGAEVQWGRTDGHLAWAEYHRALGEPEAAQQRAEQALAAANAPRQPLLLLASHRLLGDLDREAGREDEAGAHLDAALALAGACDAPYERALTLLAVATLDATSGDAAGALTALDEAQAICAHLGAAPTLARAAILAATLVSAPPSA
jgi:tetratricopeptide (TPR) repeat protein